MGAIIQNGKRFSGSGNKASNIAYDSTFSKLNASTVQSAIDKIMDGGIAKDVSLTQAEYDKLVENGTVDNEITYYITDSEEPNIVNDLVNIIYPIGSIYMSVNSTSPTALFGGTWEQIKDTFLLSAGDTYESGTTGGEATHTLTVNEMPRHEHDDWFTYSGGAPVGGNWKINMTSSTTGGSGRWTHTSGLHNVALTGGGQAHNNMPPYLTVYMWKRVA